MSLFDLKSMLGNEDFADAHEPLNDGVKKVPNAQTVAASTKTADVGTDTNSAGEAKVIPAKPDTDDATKTEHNTVKESAERSDTTKSTETSTEPQKNESTDEASDEVLEHDTEEATKGELEKTERATTALESYLPKAKRFDIIGHPKVQAAQMSKVIGYINRKSGVTGDVTVSTESISAAVDLGRNRIAKLERQLNQLSKRSVANEDISEEIAVTEAPTEHGAPPMDPVAAEALTEAEVDPLDVPLLEIERVQETIGVLEQGAAAIEQYRQIIRANPRMSKQAAAVLHAGLEHIDQMCGLKVRSTGMESYVTTPRAAMEEADIDAKSLSSRAGEIGAKILRWIKDLLEKAAGWWNEFSSGLTRLKVKIDDLAKQNFITNKTIQLSPAPVNLFIEGDFAGNTLTPDERTLPTKLDKHYTKLTQQITRRISTLLTQAGTDNLADEINTVMTAMQHESGTFAELPGEYYIGSESGRLTLVAGKPEAPETFTVEPDEVNPKRLLNELSNSIKQLIDIRTPENINKAGGSIADALIKFRKGVGKELDESEFQKIQQAVVDNSLKLFDVKGFYDILRQVGLLYNARYKLCEKLVG